EITMLVAEEQALWHERHKAIAYMEITRDGEEVIINASEKSPIRRVRRITGYLSNIDNFNDAKKQECDRRFVHAS
ncbi:MAG: anaerobic ribonucleoside triphosphate reductase, partial [Anaerosporomusa subterranea]|nr:anaerobic ribonucleoside triphosphate reductase [Anaerosporomusa subterranea]